jgi:hypothetical protein
LPGGPVAAALRGGAVSVINPNGVEEQSPGLAAAAYPGNHPPAPNPNPNGVVSEPERVCRRIRARGA